MWPKVCSVWPLVWTTVWSMVWTMVWPKVCSVWPLILTTFWRMVWPTVWTRVWRRVCSVWPLGWTTFWRMVWSTSGKGCGLRSVRSAQWSGQSLFSLANGGQSLLGLANTYLWVWSVWPIPVLGRGIHPGYTLMSQQSFQYNN